MAKVITLSRVFPSYHPDAGKPTNFVEKMWRSIWTPDRNDLCQPIRDLTKLLGYDTHYQTSAAIDTFDPKHHTIREGERWKDGDMASLRVWSDRPYHSTQLIIAPDVKLSVKYVQIANGVMWVDGKRVSWGTVAKRDGLTMQQLRWWFPKPVFVGQMLIWNNNNLPY